MITLLQGDEFNKVLLKRSDLSNKSTFGRLGLVCGCSNYQGAAYFAAMSALRTGVGIAVAFIPDSIYNVFACKINGAVIEPLSSIKGYIYDDSLCRKIMSRKCNALLCGSGLGFNEYASRVVHSVAQLDLPLVFDGDALSVIANDKSILSRKNSTVITPHIGELARLCQKDIGYVRKNRVSLAREFALQNNVTVVLKDYVTVVADNSDNTFILSNPVSSLSKGGSGDVLAGMIASFIAQNYSTVDSCVYAVTLHNACGSLCQKKFGSFFTQPDDVIDNISKLLK